MFWGKLPGRSAARDRRAIILGGRFHMCHGHVDLRTIEREVQERLRAASPVIRDAGDEPITVPPDLIGGIPGLLARLRALLPRRAAP
jgi:hypothetical protein